MAELSPAAVATLGAVHQAMAEQPFALSGVPNYRRVAAAALRAAAVYSYCPVDRRMLATIADELEGQA